MTGEVTQLRVGDEGFLVSSMIDRCPRSMMLRELVRNAIEAAQTAPEGERRVEVSGIGLGGAMKLAIWNTGRGMDADELFRMGDIASSIRKQNGLEQNFGMGAKVASLPSNRHGMRYRSCHAGRVCEVVLGQRGGVYGRLRRAGGGSDVPRDVLDATAEALAEGRSVDRDWTEIVLLGNHPGQDTLADPYDGEPRMVPHWIAEELHKRFFRLPGDVQLLLHGQANVSGEPHRFRALAERLPDYGRHEPVACEDGVVIHYVHDAFLDGDAGRTRASVGAPCPAHGFAGLVYRDETYDLAWQQDWLHVGPVYGVPFCGRNVYVFLELPDSYPVLADGYRQFVRDRGGSQGQVSLRRFAPLIHARRPGWLVRLMQDHAPDGTLCGDVASTLRNLLRELGVPRRTREVARADAPEAGTDQGEGATQAGEQAADAGALEPDDDALGRDIEPPPQIVLLREAGEVQARGLDERGARYYPETHQLFVNCLYPSVAAMQSALEREFGWAEDQETVRRDAQRAAEQSMVERVGRTLVFALSKHGVWAEWEMQPALSTQALTLAADDIHQSLPAARAGLRASLRLRQLAGTARD